MGRVWGWGTILESFVISGVGVALELSSFTVTHRRMYNRIA